MKMRFKLAGKILMPIIITGVVLTGLLIFLTAKGSQDALTDSGLTFDRYTTHVLLDMRAFYTANVIPVAKGAGARVNFDYKTHANTVPLPATFLMDLGSQITQKYPGDKIRLYSQYPFRKTAPLDDFEQKALAYLQQHKSGEYYQVENINGQPFMRYASGDLMKPSCIGCHNTRADSPKKDWQVGDLAGVLEIQSPMTSFSGATLGTKIMNLITSPAFSVPFLIAVFVVLIMFMVRRLVLGPLSQLADAAEALSSGDLDHDVTVTANDEIGDIGRAFQKMMDKLKEIVVRTRMVADTIASGAHQISSGTEQLAHSAKAQASAAEATASSIEEVAASVQQVAKNAENLGAGVEETSSAIEEMAANIRQVATHADELSGSVGQTSASIEEISASIDQVAD
ncbi:MAG: methyl-accepting chemotaxis protein, partial [Cyanobacteria bacterium REEB65]|nr:methyl-accepting chemotaxis protein [Cyanobacteria bacterium REEB65]